MQAVKTINKTRSFIMPAFLAAAMLAAGCATTQGDPLRNTKKLVAEGHASLYRNGAFEVPHTSIRLIPPGPGAAEFAAELMGMRARQSFELSIKRASESVYIVSEGTKLTYRWAKGIHEGAESGADSIRSLTRENSTLLVYRSTELGKGIVGKSWETSKQLFRDREKTGTEIIRESRESGKDIIKSGGELGDRIVSGSLDAGKDISRSSLDRSQKTFSFAGRQFVKGYAAVPGKARQRAASMGQSLEKMNPIAIVEEQNDTRKQWSQKTVDLMSDTVKNYTKNVSGSFEKAGRELKGSYQTTGLTLSALKSLRWVLQGLLWDATIKPLGSLTAASLGYIGVNFVAFPTMVVVQEGAATTKLALEVTWNAAKTGYDVVAPTGTAAVAGVFGAADFAASHAAAGAAAGVGAAAGLGEKGVSGIAGVAVMAGGYAAGKGVQYIGIPLASAGIAVGGGAIGTAVGAAGAATGGAVLVTGEAGGAGAEVFGNIIAGATMVTGAAVSTAGGAAYGVYELSKAVAVPAGYELGGGIVLSYETMSQLSAHAILAVSDCAYMVLSLEGPRWVLYAVKGKTGSGDDLPTGAVVDLKKMQGQGEEIYYLPVSDEEMKKAVDSVYDALPETQSEDTP